MKTSSLGDIVANFPVVTDVLRWRPAASIDWVVEETYAELVRLHPGVRDVIVAAQRRWRKGLLSAACRAERRAFVERLRARHYDFVIDTQGLLKSAIIARRARGHLVGYDWSSVREPLATLVYDRRVAVSRRLHAIERNRQLAASALGYRVVAPADFGLRPHAARPFAALGEFWVALHGSSRAEKLWPESHWIEVARAFVPRGIPVVLPWGTEPERMRSERLARSMPCALVPARLGLPEVAALLQRARFVVGVDTGLTHLAAALGAPVVALFSRSDPALSGVGGSAPHINLGCVDRSPHAADVVAAVEAVAPWHNGKDAIRPAAVLSEND